MSSDGAGTDTGDLPKYTSPEDPVAPAIKK